MLGREARREFDDDATRGQFHVQQVGRGRACARHCPGAAAMMSAALRYFGLRGSIGFASMDGNAEQGTAGQRNDVAVHGGSRAR